MAKNNNTFDKPLLSKNFWLSKLLKGQYSLGTSFWIFWTIPELFFSLIYFSLAQSTNTEGGLGLFLNLSLLVYLPYMVCAIIGTWKSATNYKKIKIQKKLGYGWATATYVYIIISVIRKIANVIQAI